MYVRMYVCMYTYVRTYVRTYIHNYILERKQITFFEITCVIFGLELTPAKGAAMYDHVFLEMQPYV